MSTGLTHHLVSDEQARPLDESDGESLLDRSRFAATAAGALALVAGIVLLVWPKASLRVVGFLVGIFLVISGMIIAINAPKRASGETRWGLTMLRALLDVVIGITCIFWPRITVLVLVVLIGIELLAGGLLSFAIATQIPKGSEDRHMFGAVVTVAAGLVVLIWPGATIRVLAIVIGIYLVAFGLLSLLTAHRLGKAQHS